MTSCGHEITHPAQPVQRPVWMTSSNSSFHCAVQRAGLAGASTSVTAMQGSYPWPRSADQPVGVPERPGPGREGPTATVRTAMPPPRHLQAGRRAASSSSARRSGRQRAVLLALGTVFVLLVGALTVVGYALVQLNSINRYEDLDVDAAPAGEPENYLVVDSDSREGGTAEEAASVDGRRSDTIMVLRIDPQEESAAVLSLPRDLIVPIAPSGEEARINSAYSTGTPDEGRQALIDTIRMNFGVELNHYVEIDFQGFARLVDAVGGVPLWFDAAVRDRESGLYQTNLGCVTLPGDQALPFVRSRHLQYMTPYGDWESDPTGDLGRITRQQVFMRNALSKVTAEASNPLRTRELVEITVDAVGLDGEMGISDILDLADRFRDFDTSQLLTYSLPIVENDDGATVSVDDVNAEPVLELFRGDDVGDAARGVAGQRAGHRAERHGRVRPGQRGRRGPRRHRLRRAGHRRRAGVTDADHDPPPQRRRGLRPAG